MVRVGTRRVVSGVLAALGGSAGVVTLSGASISDTFAATCAVGVTFKSDGTVTKGTTSGGTTQLSSTTDWIRPVISPGSYTVRAHVASGTSPAGDSLDTDLALSSDRGWTLTQIASGNKSCSLTITIKLGGTTVASATYSLSATVP